MHQPIKNIIFDLGGVIIDISYQSTADAFNLLGFNQFEMFYSKAQQTNLFDDFEVGKIDQNTFVNQLKLHLPENITTQQVIDAWNAMLIGIPQQRFNFIKQLSKHYRIFLLSNTNEIHVSAFTAMNDEKFGKGEFESLFERVYYSSAIRMRKPNAEIFEYLINSNLLDKSNTLFVDDSVQHINGANKIGLTTKHLLVEAGETIEKDLAYLLVDEFS